jgi:hypothetical protein
MADEELRALERRWRSTGAVDDETAFLAAKLRAGLFDEQRLRLAAFVGDPAAALVAGCEAAPRDLLTRMPGQLWQYMMGVEAWGTRAAVRLALASARAIHRLGPELGLPRHALTQMAGSMAVAEQWLAAPSGARARLAMQEHKRADAARNPADCHELWFRALDSAAQAAHAAAYGVVHEGGATARTKARAAGRAAGRSSCSAAVVLNMAGRDRRPLLNGIWWEVSWWALGLSA